MRKLFIYYSLTGNGDFIASKMLERGYEVRKVIEKKKMPKSFFWRILIGGFRAGMNKKAKLIDYDSDISNYDEVVIGSPVWNGRFPPAINTVLLKTDFKDKKLSFLFYSGSGDRPKVMKKINENYPNSEVIILKEPKTHVDELDKIIY